VIAPYRALMPSVTLEPMTADEFERWRQHSISEYAKEHVAAGNYHEDEAAARSRAEFDELLPDGLATEDILLLQAKDSDGVDVGILWLSLTHPRGAPDTAFIFDIEVLTERRGQGYGRAVLAAGEDEIRRRGIGALGLNVFGDNPTAIALYTSAGYTVTTQQMRKLL
jgi:ribosomal protein S18 acetylase RimI-like enzyme